MPPHTRFPLMDSIRALAALSIFGFHASLQFALPSWGEDLAQTLTVGVPVFFVVSGFLLYRPFALAHLRDESAPHVGAYAWRRVLRIVPAFWLALTVFVVLGPAQERLADLPLLYGFAQVYDPRTAAAGIGQAWSLDCEIVYYAAIPLVAVGIRVAALSSYRARLRAEIAALAFLLALSVAYKLWFFGWGAILDPRDAIFTLHPAWNLDLFVAGMGMAVWWAHAEATGRTDAVARFASNHAGSLWAAALVLFLAAAWRANNFDDSDLGSFELQALRALFAVCLVLPAIYGARADPVRRLLALRPMLALGVVSYGFYLFHQMWISLLVDQDLPGLSATAGKALLLVLALAGSIATATACWVMVERPALALRRLVPGRERP